MSGSWWRGRPVAWDPDRQAVEQERQRWVYERLATDDNLIRDLTVDPDKMYATFRAEYERTGNTDHLRRMLEYVR